MTNNTSFIYPFNTNEKANSYMPGYGDISISNMPSQPYNYDDSKEATQDNAYILFLFPEEARKIKEIVAKALDKLDYEGSVIYHEYPDKSNIEEIINEIYPQIDNQISQPDETKPDATATPDMSTASTTPPCKGYNCSPPYYSPSHFPDGRPNWKRQLLESLFFDEIVNRRRKYFNKMFR